MYHFDEGAFELPEDYTDRTVNIFETKREGATVAVSITREPMPAGMSIEAVADHFVKEMSTRLRRFEILRRAPSTVGSMPAVEVLYTFFHQDGGLVAQEQVFIEYMDRLVLVGMTGPARLQATLSRELKEMLKTLKLRKR